MSSKQIKWIWFGVITLSLILGTVLSLKLQPNKGSYAVSIKWQHAQDRFNKVYNGYFCGGAIQHLEKMMKLLRAGQINKAQEWSNWKGFKHFMANESNQSRLAAVIYQPLDLVPEMKAADGKHYAQNTCLITAHFFAPQQELQSNSMVFEYQQHAGGWILWGIK